MLRLRAAGVLEAHLRQAQAAATSWRDGIALALVVVGKTAPGLDGCLAELQLELAISVRRVSSELELSQLLASFSRTLAAAAKKWGAAGQAGGQAGRPEDLIFLGGLYAQDVLANRKSRAIHRAPRNLSEAWLGALQQIVPDNAARAVYDAYPSFRRLHDGFRAAQKPEALLENLRVGNQRLGPCKSKKIHRVLTAAQDEAEENW